jgi:hypothetical protein
MVMQVTIRYQQAQVDEAVKFLSTYNRSWQGKDKYIRDSIYRHFLELAQMFGQGNRSISTLGYRIRCFVLQEEGIDNDMNILRMEVMVDPAIGSDDDREIEETYTFSPVEEFE